LSATTSVPNSNGKVATVIDQWPCAAVAN
jgi:hypothetical protein